ncbi:hypothetical protein WISP_94042 [Willisornis vidua]|uniref:Uncharacterized protein n=1 Tax=Willisornis vidua TaxID=1566151 RepID=A0ABQ9D0I9_9PASS|nr:hypothetical protein WISP_94042 [Willisornis vidua]
MDRLLTIIFERPWRSGEVPEDWKKANVTPSKGARREDPWNYQPDSLTTIPGKVMEHRNLETISIHMEDKKVIGSSQHGFTKVLGSSAKERHGVDPVESHNDDYGTGASLLQGKAEGLGPVQP